MKTIQRTPRTRGGLRALVRRGSRSERRGKAAELDENLADETMCERCGNVYRDKRWHEGTSGERSWPIGFAWTVCPACRQLAQQEFLGRVLVRGAAALAAEDAIRRRVANVAARARFTQPQRRIVSIERKGDALEVLTTSQKLAHRVVAALIHAFGGQGAFAWSSDDGELHATWTWEGGAPHAPAPREPARLPAKERRARALEAAAGVGKQPPDLEIQRKNLDLEPMWRDRIERTVEAWGARYPDLTRVHVTLGRGRHHRRGADEVMIAARQAGQVFHVTKRAGTMMVALREALHAVERELVTIRDQQRHVLKPPNPRLVGSVKRIWRDAGYGFIRLDRGREAYFHKDSLHGLKFLTLTPGTPVEVELEQGERGLQAASVFPVGQRDRA